VLQYFTPQQLVLLGVMPYIAKKIDGEGERAHLLQQAGN
jgi:hypothetical protein